MPEAAQASAPPTGASPPPMNITSLERFSKDIRSRIFDFLCQSTSRPLLFALLRTSKATYARAASQLYSLPITLDKKTASVFFYPLMVQGKPAHKVYSSYQLPPKTRDNLMNPTFEGYTNDEKEHSLMAVDRLVRKILLIGRVPVIRIADAWGLVYLTGAVKAFSKLVEKEGGQRETLGKWGRDDFVYKSDSPEQRALRAERLKKMRFPAVLFWKANRVVFDEPFIVQLAMAPKKIAQLLWRLREEDGHFVKDFVGGTGFCVHLPDAKLAVEASDIMCQITSGNRQVVGWHNIDPREFKGFEKGVCLEGNEVELYLKPEASGSWAIRDGIKSINRALRRCSTYTESNIMLNRVYFFGSAIATTAFFDHNKRRVLKSPSFPVHMKYSDIFLAVGPTESLLQKCSVCGEQALSRRAAEAMRNGRKEEDMLVEALQEAERFKERLAQEAANAGVSVRRHRINRQKIEVRMSRHESPLSDFYSTKSGGDYSETEDEERDLGWSDDGGMGWSEDEGMGWSDDDGMGYSSDEYEGLIGRGW
ncbi:hypothetical protein IAT38_007817 [Cryptococcus sp. DSM 104549]